MHYAGVWQWINGISTVLIAFTSVLGVAISFFIIRSFRQNKEIHRQALALKTIKYLANIDKLLSEGSDFVREYQILLKRDTQWFKDFKKKTQYQFEDGDTITYADFFKRARAALSPLVDIYHLIQQGVFDDKLVADVIYPQVEQIYTGTKGYVDYLQEIQNDPSAYIEVKKLCDRLRDKYS